KQSNFLIILLSVLLLLSVLIAGFFAYQTQKLVKELTILKTESIPTLEVTMEPTIEPVATDSSEVDPTANWKTYTDPNFSFKYPIEWSAPKEQSKTINIDDKLIITKGPFYDLVLKRNLSFDEYVIRGYGDETFRYDYDKIIGFVGKRGLEKPITGNSDLIILAKDNNSTQITSILYKYKPQDEDGKLFDQILSTFKFTN
ncbi:MAG: hypothetical protein Q8R00_00025, partial [Candidatus Nanoarchaeia archaeon]|nr:hypothetical protein [Candidatus Nanoarchaeia archaeon]